MDQKKNPARNQSATVHELIQEGHKRLLVCNKANPSMESEILALHVLGYTKLERILNSKVQVSEEDENYYKELIAQRCSGVPVQYITKEQEFMGLPFYVDSNVLIPRQDTETLVELLIDKSKDKPFKNIIEVGVGSGCISISLAKFLSDVHITGIDISESALKIARKNAKINQVEDCIQWIYGDLLKDYESKEKADLIVSNPPYISSEDCRELDENVKDYEPMLALDGGEDGLGFYRDITKQSKKHLANGGMLAYEIGYDQSKDVRDIMVMNGFMQIEQIKDLAGKDRIVLGILNGKSTNL